MSESSDNSLPEIRALWDFNDPAKSEANFRRLLTQTADQADLTYQLQIKTQLARSLGLQKKFADADAVLDEVEKQLDEAPPIVRVRFLLERGRVRNSSGNPEVAKPLFEQALSVAEESGEDALALDALHMVAIACQGREALEWNLRGIKIAEASENPKARGWLGPLYNNTGWTYHDDFKEYEKALDLFQKGVKFRTEQGQVKETQIAHWCVARALRSLGRVKEALEIQEKLKAEHAAAGTKDGFVQEELAECNLILGNPEAAQAAAALAAEQLAEMDWFKEEHPKRIERMKGVAAGTIKE